MNRILKIMGILNSKDSDDYWQDEGINQAVTILETFDPDEWESLLNSWRSFRWDVQVKLAGLLSEIPRQQSIPILTEMLAAENVSLKEAAIDSLNSIVQDYPEWFSNTAELRNAILAINPTDHKLIELLRKNLLSRLTED